MNQTFHVRDDWIESKLKSETRKTIFATSIVVVLSMGVWWFAKSWIPLVVCALGVAFCAYVFAHIPGRRKIFGSLRLTASETGLTFSEPEDDRELFYPWTTITYRVNTAKAGSPESITIGNDAQASGDRVGS